MAKSTARFIVATLALALAVQVAPAHGKSSYMDGFGIAYPDADATRIDDCALCHTASIPTRNSYGAAWRSAGRSYSAIAGLDSDGDGIPNDAEIAALTFPGDPGDPPPSPPPDTVAPTVTGFVIPAASSSLTVPVTTFTATDDVGVTGYRLTETPGAPAAGAAGWSPTAPTSHTFGSAGTHTLYAWARDGAGNVSASRSDAVTITLADTVAPTVTGFVIPAASDSLTVTVTTFTATDNVGVTGYRLTETPGAPAAGAAGWSPTAPTSHTFGSAGAHTLYAWARDGAGNVSASRSDAVTITIPSPKDVLYEDDFPEWGGGGSWEQVRGYFGRIGGAFVALGNRVQITLVDSVAQLDPFRGGRIATSLLLERPRRGTSAFLVFDYQDHRHYRYVRLDGRRRQLQIGQVGSFAGDRRGVKARLRAPQLFKPMMGSWHRLALDIDPVTGEVAVTVDEGAAPSLTASFASTGIGRVGLGSTRGRLRVLFDDFEVSGPPAQP